MKNVGRRNFRDLEVESEIISRVQLQTRKQEKGSCLRMELWGIVDPAIHNRKTQNYGLNEIEVYFSEIK